MTVVGGNIKTEPVPVETPQEMAVDEKPKKTTKRTPKKGEK